MSFLLLSRKAELFYKNISVSFLGTEPKQEIFPFRSGDTPSEAPRGLLTSPVEADVEDLEGIILRLVVEKFSRLSET